MCCVACPYISVGDLLGSSRRLEFKIEGTGEAIISIYPARASNNEAIWCIHCRLQDYSSFQAADIRTHGPICSRRSH